MIFLPRVVLGQNVKVKINPSTSDHKAQKLGKVHASSTPCKGRGFQEANECRKVTRKCSEGTFPSRCGGNPPGVWGGGERDELPGAAEVKWGQPTTPPLGSASRRFAATPRVLSTASLREKRSSQRRSISTRAAAWVRGSEPGRACLGREST